MLVPAVITLFQLVIFISSRPEIEVKMGTMEFCKLPNQTNLHYTCNYAVLWKEKINSLRRQIHGLHL